MRYAARPDDVARAHQALAEVSRLRLLEVIRAQPAGLSAADAGDEVGFHQATARQHLEMLVEAGLVVREAEPRTVRGRPRVIYRRSGQTEAGVGDGYHLLTGPVTMLSGPIPATTWSSPTRASRSRWPSATRSATWKPRASASSRRGPAPTRGGARRVPGMGGALLPPGNDRRRRRDPGPHSHVLRGLR